ERNQQILDLEHYLDVLERKPGALAGAKPLLAWRQRGLWPESYDRLLAELGGRHGKSTGTRPMIQGRGLVKQPGQHDVPPAIEARLSLECSDAAAIRHRVQPADLVRAQSALVEVGALSRFERPLPVLTDYDKLLDQEAAS